MATYNKYTPEQQKFLAKNAPHMSRKELTERFNREFGTDKSVLAIKSYCNQRGYNSPNTGKFERGNVSWQTGLSKEEYKSHFTQESFERGIEKMLQSHKTRKIGDEIVIAGVPWIVTSLEYGVPFSERRTPKRRVVWEEYNGEIPQDCCIINLDGDPMNCDISNLYCLQKRYVPLIGKNRWWFGNAELTLTAIKWCELQGAIKSALDNTTIL